MPNLNFDYTQFLKKQNALYLLKYQSEPIEVAENPQPISGYHGHTPAYRGSIHEQRMVRSLVRCLTSPMKPTTATGFRNNPDNFPRSRPKTGKPPDASKSKEDASRRAQSAPPKVEEDKNETKKDHAERRPTVSSLSMMSAGSADYVRQKINKQKTLQASLPQSRPHSNASSVSYRTLVQNKAPNHPTGYPHTLYGASYWYDWQDAEQPAKTSSSRPGSFQKDRSFNRQHQVIYHKHEGVLPKYMGYVPGYKFRHGSTYGVLTVNATKDGTVHRRLLA